MEKFVEIALGSQHGYGESPQFYPVGVGEKVDCVDDGKIVRVEELRSPGVVSENIQLNIVRGPNGRPRILLKDATFEGRTAWWLNKELTSAQLAFLRFDLSNLD